LRSIPGAEPQPEGAEGFRRRTLEQLGQFGFVRALSGDLRMNANGQSFAFKPEERPTGRWVRRAILGNHGDDYTGFTGFHGSLGKDA
jgi:hypothetical protein